jgi:hypothetical protein
MAVFFSYGFRHPLMLIENFFEFPCVPHMLLIGISRRRRRQPAAGRPRRMKPPGPWRPRHTLQRHRTRLPSVHPGRRPRCRCAPWWPRRPLLPVPCTPVPLCGVRLIRSLNCSKSATALPVLGRQLPGKSPAGVTGNSGPGPGPPAASVVRSVLGPCRELDQRRRQGTSRHGAGM